MNDDLYSVLGVLPDAEDVVIRAVYRALAQRYHPDRWDGDPFEANERMARINRAAEVLSDPKLRAEYDRGQLKGSQAAFDSEPNDARAFQDAMAVWRERWEIACSVYSDLEAKRQRLAKISMVLSFSYVSMLLETKAFQDRVTIADHMENTFLIRYFGSNEKTLKFARDLIDEGARGAARRLNQLVDVLGPSVDPDLLVRRVQAEYPNIRSSKEEERRRQRLRELEPLMLKVQLEGNYDDAIELVKALSMEVNERSAGFFSDVKIDLSGHRDRPLHFASRWTFIDWVRDNLCKPIGDT